MILFLEIISIFLIIGSFLPLIPSQHWIFRTGDFTKVQLTVLQLALITVAAFYMRQNLFLMILQGVQCLFVVYHFYLLIRFTKFWRSPKQPNTGTNSDSIKIISYNVFQYNTDYANFVNLVREEQPDIVLTMESNEDWEKAMRQFEGDFSENVKVTLENTYGMHLYTKFKIIRKQVHYFVADDLPSIEAELETKDGYRFLFFGVHPPPPSPTEEETSKERDGDLLSVAKRVRDSKIPVVVTGDFNNVAWAKSSILFKKTSELIDARVGRGFLSTFHTKYWFFNVPLDLLFHSPSIFIQQLFTYPDIGSDHYPIGATFCINRDSAIQEEDVKKLDTDEMEEVHEMIEEGKQEESDNR